MITLSIVVITFITAFLGFLVMSYIVWKQQQVSDSFTQNASRGHSITVESGETLYLDSTTHVMDLLKWDTIYTYPSFKIETMIDGETALTFLETGVFLLSYSIPFQNAPPGLGGSNRTVFFRKYQLGLLVDDIIGRYSFMSLDNGAVAMTASFLILVETNDSISLVVTHNQGNGVIIPVGFVQGGAYTATEALLRLTVERRA